MLEAGVYLEKERKKKKHIFQEEQNKKLGKWKNEKTWGQKKDFEHPRKEKEKETGKRKRKRKRKWQEKKEKWKREEWKKFKKYRKMKKTNAMSRKISQVFVFARKILDDFHELFSECVPDENQQPIFWCRRFSEGKWQLSLDVKQKQTLYVRKSTKNRFAKVGPSGNN